MNTNMCVKALASLVVAGAIGAASADLLYWTVSAPEYDENSGMEGDPVAYTYATVSADGGVSHLKAYNQDGETEFWKLYAVKDANTNPTYFGSFDSSTTPSLLVELWDGGGRIGWKSYSVASIAESIWPADSTQGAGGKVLEVSRVVPEPTSGLLLLVGGALLALRRRRGGVC